jgi:hypothetical protein
MDVPHQLSQEAIDRFKEIYLEEFGEAISDDQAQEMGLRLLRIFWLLSDLTVEGNARI